ncbi:hypothetical protein C8Q80DRAFT_1125023 [Daedaleopsis nitida]|nr:hypothetical protein C8Q80DRAFT_1125023 [Daedaleopsis nitida]
MANRTPNLSRTPNRTPGRNRNVSRQHTHPSPCKREVTTPTKKTPVRTKESPTLYRNFWLCPRTAPRRGPTTAHFHTARQRVERLELELGEIDVALGKEIALLLDYVPANLPSNSIYVDVALRHCFDSLGLTHHLPKTRDLPDSLYDIDYYADPEGVDGPDDLKLPVFWMNDMNAHGIDYTYPGAHGFGWMVTAECSLFDYAGPFHLVNAPGQQDQGMQRNWRYCGKYYAHRTELAMSLDGWKALPEYIRAAAASICVGHPSRSVGTVEEAYDLFDSGQRRPELVIFQFCGMPNREFLGRLKESAALFVKPPCTPENKLARERIFLKHPDSIEDFLRIQQRMCSGRTE